MTLTASQLRANVYRLLDQAIETGQPIEIQRKGVIVRLVPPVRPDRLARLVRRDDVINGDPDDLVEIDWSSSWDPGEF